MSRKPLCQDLKILEDQSIALCLRQPMRSPCAKLGGCLTHTQQQIMHGLRPGLVIPLSNEQSIA